MATKSKRNGRRSKNSDSAVREFFNPSAEMLLSALVCCRCPLHISSYLFIVMPSWYHSSFLRGNAALSKWRFVDYGAALNLPDLSNNFYELLMLSLLQDTIPKGTRGKCLETLLFGDTAASITLNAHKDPGFETCFFDPNLDTLRLLPQKDAWPIGDTLDESRDLFASKNRQFASTMVNPMKGYVGHLEPTNKGP